MDIIKPNLTIDADLTKLKFPYYAQPKIDGVRGIHLWGKPYLTARSLKPFGNTLVPLIFDNVQGYDGELTYGNITSPDLCRNTTSVVTTYNDIRAADLVLNLFDYITPTTIKLPYEKRYDLLSSLASEPLIKVVSNTVINTLDELLEFEETCVGLGYEGVILRNPKGMYKNGRSTVQENTFLRLKQFTQEDALVIDLIEAYSNQNEATTNALGNIERSSHKNNLVPNNMVGTLICIDRKTGNKIKVGPGKMTHEDRKYYWNYPELIIGQTISYKSMPYGKLNAPRFPTFEYIRPIEDLTNE